MVLSSELDALMKSLFGKFLEDDASELLSCPFCSENQGNPTLFYGKAFGNRTSYYVECQRCHFRAPVTFVSSSEEGSIDKEKDLSYSLTAIRTWNRIVERLQKGKSHENTQNRHSS